MTFLYTIRGAFGNNCDKDGLSWVKYIEWSKLTHLNEVVTLDGMLNEDLIEPDYNENLYHRQCTSLDYSSKDQSASETIFS